METKKILYVIGLLLVAILVMGQYTGCQVYMGEQATISCELEDEPICPEGEDTVQTCTFSDISGWELVATTDPCLYDVAISLQSTTPEAPEAGQEFDLNAVVSNDGSVSLDPAEINIILYEGESVIVEDQLSELTGDTDHILPEGWVEVVFSSLAVSETTTYTAVVGLEGDIDSTDDSDAYVVEIAEEEAVENSDPYFTAWPDATEYATVGTEFTLQVEAEDADGDTLTFSLQDELPSGITIDSTGYISGYTPVTGDEGMTYNIEIWVDDGNGGSAMTDFTLAVEAEEEENNAPYFTLVPDNPDYATVGVEYTFYVEADDDDKDDLTYSLDDHYPDGMTIDSSGYISGWTPESAEVGYCYSIEILLEDARGATADYGFDLCVETSPDYDLYVDEAGAGSTVISGISLQYFDMCVATHGYTEITDSFDVKVTSHNVNGDYYDSSTFTVSEYTIGHTCVDIGDAFGSVEIDDSMTYIDLMVELDFYDDIEETDETNNVWEGTLDMP